MRQALTIAGSDSGGGAGIQADLKSFAAAGVYGTSVITSVTSQNTQGVTDIFNLPLDSIESQIDAIFADFDISCVKTGMLSTAEIIQAVSDRLQNYNVKKLVVDPVMVAKGGSRLLEKNAVNTLVESLIPQAYIITPNIEEGEFLLNCKINNEEDMRKAAKELMRMGSEFVLLKGGHLKSRYAKDILVGTNVELSFSAEKIGSKNTHGTGCTYASSIAAYLAKGFDIDKAVQTAKNYIYEAISSSRNLRIGSGHGPLNHFFYTRSFDSAD
ncbi:MAG: bifunctional hydroxymethylpyrimidine kinase/phosphomethylpyrimidine kinase [Flexistipes sinusarabici]|uniref:hydroxymethylpyrimidine kinase n=1 Tax=Flexistipes sinusarabici TaxID=2352 RepID=A0A5D0MUV7_FLESI|nr:bifunctional hydroxymethylpyrimidine kinase/phosphomethylpyrimidine kinase [Flexistipes sinusarabici]TYB35815.1 MAG: bifunctional hydroxymethylpyrimidine kinase/phosphomethylpyrimidine kinase [Flexistipes sinusarabici]